MMQEPVVVEQRPHRMLVGAQCQRALAGIHNGRYRWHDLRRTVASRLAGLGFSEAVIGRILNHARSGVTATVYNQYDYLDEKRRALDAWADELERILAGKPKGGRLVRMRRRA